MRWSPLPGALCLLRGVVLLARAPLRPFVMVPLLVNSLLFGFGTLWFFRYYRDTVHSVDQWIPSWLHWINWLNWIEWLLLPIFLATLITIVSLAFTAAANLISAPFNSLLAEKAEQLLTGRPLPPAMDSLATVIGNALRSLQHELKKLIRISLWMLMLWLLSFVPGLNIASSVVGILLASWLLAWEYLDFPMGNRGIQSPEIRRYMRQEPMVTLGFGLAALAMAMVPGLNLLAVPTAVVGATLLWLDYLQPSLSKVTQPEASSPTDRGTGYLPEKQASQ
ncbi:MAG: sulfate transporter CysZ [Magnetococcales bacterium]|nr:sulfate transporter CysZ [Magnetococcales bacterium]